MTKKNNHTEEIDEQMLLSSINNKKSSSPISSATVSVSTKISAKKLCPPSPNQYESTFLQYRELKARQAVYISRFAYEKILKIVKCGENTINASSFIEGLLIEHFNEFKDIINELNNREREQIF